MKPSEALSKKRNEIRFIIESHHAFNARIFGSVAKGEDNDQSDLDILIDPGPETTMFDIGAIRRKLKALLGVTVDVLTPNALPENFREEVLVSSIPL